MYIYEYEREITVADTNTSLSNTNKRNVLLLCQQHYFMSHIFINFERKLHYWLHKKYNFIANSFLLYVLVELWCKLPEECDNATTYRC
jgi:hypothetical protein